MKLKIYSLFLLFSLSAVTVSAQNYFGMNAQVSLPQNEFKQKGYSIGGGVGFQYLTKNLIPSLTTIQTRINYQFDISTAQSKRIKDISIPNSNERGDAYYSNSSFGFSVGPQFSVSIGKRWQPYVTAFGTAKAFNSQRSYYSDSYNYVYYGDDFFIPTSGDSENLYSAIRFQYGYGGGIMYKVADKTHINISVSYLKGNGTTFVRLKSIKKTTEGNTEFSTEKSRTSETLNAYLGVVFNL